MKNYIQILDAGFQEIQVGVIPATVDQVMVGDITRSRLEAVKVLFFRSKRGHGAPEKERGSLYRTVTGRLSENGYRAGSHDKRGWLHPEILSVSYDVKALPTAGAHLCRTYAGRQEPETSNLMGEVGKLFPGMKTLDSIPWNGRCGPGGCQEMLIQGFGNAGTGEDDRERRKLPLCSSSSILYIAGAPG